jgi:hypothetical protein
MLLRAIKQQVAARNGTIDYCTRFVDAQGGQETLGAYPLNANL